MSEMRENQRRSKNGRFAANPKIRQRSLREAERSAQKRAERIDWAEEFETFRAEQRQA